MALIQGFVFVRVSLRCGSDPHVMLVAQASGSMLGG